MNKIFSFLTNKKIAFIMLIVIVGQIAYPLGATSSVYAKDIMQQVKEEQQPEAVEYTACSSCDYGDAPSTYGPAGARYGFTIKPSAGIVTGPASDNDGSTPRYSSGATGDDANGRDDENGINGSGPTSLYMSVDDPAQTFEVSNNISGTASIGIWIDLNGDGDFLSNDKKTVDPGEGQIFEGTSGDNTYNFTFDKNMVNRDGVDGNGNTFMRIRAVQGMTLTPEDAEQNFPSNTGETEDYKLKLKNTEYYSSLNHLAMKPQACGIDTSVSPSRYLFEGVPYGGSPTGRVDIEILHSGTGTIDIRCGEAESDKSDQYYGWYTTGYDGTISIASYVDTDKDNPDIINPGDGDTLADFDRDTAIPMNITFTTNDLDKPATTLGEQFRFDASTHTEGENLFAEFTHNSAVKMYSPESSGTGKYIIRAWAEGAQHPSSRNNGEEYSTAWTTVQTSSDIAKPETFEQDNSSLVIDASMSHAAQPIYPISATGGFKVEDISDAAPGPDGSTINGGDGENWESEDDKETRLEDYLKYRLTLSNVAIKDDSKEHPNAISFKEFKLNYGDSLLDPTSFSDFTLKAPDGTEICSVNTKSTTASCGPLTLNLDEAKQELTLSAPAGSPYLWDIDDDGYFIEYQVKVGSTVGSGGSVHEPHYTITTEEAGVSDEVYANELSINRPKLDTADFTVDYNISDDNKFATTLSPDGLTCPGTGAFRAVAVDGCAQQGETIYNKITIKNTSKYGQRLNLYLSPNATEKLDVENDFVDPADLAGLVEISLNGSPLSYGDDFEVKYNDDTSRTELQMYKDVNQNDELVITFETKVDLTKEDGTAYQPDTDDGQGAGSSNWIKNNLRLITTDPINLDGTGEDNNNNVSSEQFYIEWGDDTISGFNITLTAKDTGEEVDSVYYNANKTSTESTPGEAEPNEYIEYALNLENSGVITQNNFVLDLSGLSDPNLNTSTASNIKYSIDDGAKTSLGSDYKISVGTLAAGTSKKVLIEVPVNKTIDYTVDPKEISEQEIKYSSSITDASIISNTVPLTDESTTPGVLDFTIDKNVKEKVSGDSKASVDEDLTYTMTVTNNGFSNLSGLVITDDLDDVDLDTSTVSNVVVAGEASANEATDGSFEVTSNKAINNGESIVVTFDIKAASTFDASDTIDTTASASYASITEEETTTHDPSAATPDTYDIAKDTTLDPTDPDAIGVEFTKEVTDSTSPARGFFSRLFRATDNKASAGETLHYTYTIKNVPTAARADVALKNVVLTEPLDDADLDTASISNLIVDGTASTEDVTAGITVGDIAPDSEVVVTFDVNAADTFDTSDEINTTATIAADNFDGKTIDEDDSAAAVADIAKDTTLDPTDPDAIGVEFTKEVTDTGDSKASVGETLTYTYTIKNVPTAARADVALKNVVLTEPLDDVDLDAASISNLTVDGTASTEDVTAGITVGDIAPDSEVVVTFDVNAADAFDTSDEINTTATIAADNFDGKTIDEDDSAAAVADIAKDTTLDPTDPDAIGVEFTKAVTDSTSPTRKLFRAADNKASAGETLTYTYTIKNVPTAARADVALKNVVLTEPLDDVDLDAASISNLTVGGTASTEDITAGITVGDIAPDSEVVVTFDVNAADTFDESAEINTTATMTADNFDGKTIDEDDSAAAVADIEKDMTIDPTNPEESGITFTKEVTEKTADDSKADATEALHYTYTIENKTVTKAASPILNAVVTEPLDDVDLDAASVSNIAIDGTPATGDVTAGLEIGNVEVDQTVLVEFDVNAANTFDGSETINTTATLGAENFGGSTIDEDDTAAGDLADIEKDLEITTGPDGGIEFTKEVTDADGDNLAQPGEELTYTYSLVNGSPVALQDAQLKDDLLIETDLSDVATSNTVTVTYNDGTPELTKTVQDVIGGLELGEVPASQEITVTFKVNANETFKEANGLNSEAFVKAGNIEEEVKEAYDGATESYVDVTPDIAQDSTIDPIGPDGTPNVVLEKVVTDADGSNAADLNEELTYTYTVTNKASAVLQGAKLKDNLLAEVDLSDVDTSAPVTITKQNGSTDTTQTVQNVIDGIALGGIKPGKEVKVEFKVNADSTFEAVNGLNSQAIVTSKSLPGPVKEAYDAATETFVDVKPDIAQDTTTDPIGPDGKPSLEFIKEVTDADGDGLAQTNEELTYKYTMTNKATKALKSVKLTDNLLEELDLSDIDPTTSITVTKANGEVDTTQTVQNVMDGLPVGVIAPGTSATVEFTVPVNDLLLDSDNVINSKGRVTTPSIAKTQILETYDGSKFKDVDDIEEDRTVDPTDPENGLTFTKAVTDGPDGIQDGKAQKGETLIYTYEIENVHATRTSTLLTGVVLTDPLDDKDVDGTTVTNITVDGNPVTGDVTAGLELEDIAPGQKVEVQFEVLASGAFDSSKTIDTTATLATDNLETPLEEDDSAAGASKDIEKSNEKTSILTSNSTAVTTSEAKEISDSLAGADNQAIADWAIDYFEVTGRDEKGNVITGEDLKGKTVAYNPIELINNISEWTAEDTGSSLPGSGKYKMELDYNGYVGYQYLYVIDDSSKSLKEDFNFEEGIKTIIELEGTKYELRTEEDSIMLKEEIDSDEEVEYKVEGGRVSGRGKEAKFIKTLVNIIKETEENNK